MIVKRIYLMCGSSGRQVIPSPQVHNVPSSTKVALIWINRIPESLIKCMYVILIAYDNCNKIGCL